MSATTTTSTAAASTTDPAPAADPAGPTAGRGPGRGRVLGVAVWRALSPLVVSTVAALVVWFGVLRAYDISPLIGKTPDAVWEYLFTAPEAAENRTAVWTPMKITLRDASIGFVSGMVAALVVGLLFVLFRSVEQSLMPIAMLLRSVPLIAMTPLITLIFGRELLGIAVICGIVVFFPALVNVVQGLRSVPDQTRDLVHAYGGSDLTVLVKVGVPSALPAIFAAMKISVPGALVGALVAEWLATGAGIGSSILSAIGGFRYDELWASIAALTAISVLLYTLMGVLEQAVLAKYAPDSLRR